MNDDELGRRLRAALPASDDRAARRDLWPSVVRRLSERPRWSLIDVGLGIAAAVALLVSPERLLLLAYHL